MKPDFPKFLKSLSSASLWLGVFGGGVILTALLTHYPGLISMKWGLDGGHITLDGRPLQK